ncbi:MAG TPA: hypothetical protein VFH90_06705, partial [Candidatus Limnocylindria bacterium]|nr:hypothetical protein [Candidatus Limnocylindria bacterium]
MGELGVRLRALVGGLPVGLERLGRAAVGSPASWSWLPPAVPWLVAAGAALGGGAIALSVAEIARDYPTMATVGAALLGGGVLLGLAAVPRRSRSLGLAVRAVILAVGAAAGGVAGTFFSEAITDAPLVAGVVAGLMIGLVVLVWRLQIARSAQVAATTIGFVPAVAWSLIILAAVPALQAGSEIIIARTTVSAFVQRQVGFSSPVIDIRGLALLQPLRAEPPFDPELGPLPGSYHWLAIRDELTDTGMGLVRTSVDPQSLQRREIVGRVRDDIDTEAALAALAARGIELPDGAASVALQALAPDDASSAGNVTEIDSVGDLAGVTPGTLVRLTLDLPGDAVAACVLSDGCQARRLALGIGPWLHLARDPADDQPGMVQLAYPPSVAPVHVFGRQERDPGAVARLLDGPQVRLMLGWAQVLRGAVVDHDPELPVDRLWIGPLLFVVFALLLLAGRGIGYPIFRPRPLAPPRWVP